MSSTDNDEPFLSRWARLKRDTARKAGESAGEVAADVGSDGGAAASPASVAGNAEPVEAEHELDLTTLPRVEDLTADSDIAAFLDKRVPAALRNAALGQIWTLDPTIRDFIEVAENQWNWNIPGGAPFYEEMAPGSAGGLFADATSAIARVAGPPAEVVADSAGVVNVVENERHGFVDQSSTQNIAVQQDQQAADRVAADVGDADLTAVAMASASGLVDDAVQQNAPETDVQPRRRHGGALPV